MKVVAADADRAMKKDPQRAGSRRPLLALAIREAMTASRFAAVGVVATLIHMAVVWVLADAYGVMVFKANCMAYLCAFGFSFAGHQIWTFGGKASMRRSFARFFVISLSGFLVNSTLLALILKTGWLSPPVSALIAVLCVPALTFAASRLWGFNER